MPTYLVIIHHDEKVDIAVLMRIATSVRPEQIDFHRVKNPDHAIEQLFRNVEAHFITLAQLW